MPTINLGKKKQRDRTFNKQAHQDIYQDKRWKRLVAVKKRLNPLCERCEGLGVVTQMKEVHHIVPFESDFDRREELAFDIDNTMSVCTPCHKILDREFKYKK